MLRADLWILRDMNKTLAKRSVIDPNALDVQLLEAFYVRDCGKAEAVTLSFEVSGMAVQILLREAVPVGSCRDLQMRTALAHVCDMLIRWAEFGRAD